MEGLTIRILGELLPTLPPIDEQEAIVDRIAQEATLIDQAIGGTRAEITLLRELRTRLIADVITGQLDFRAAAAALPDEPTDDEPLDDAAPEDA